MTSGSDGVGGRGWSGQVSGCDERDWFGVLDIRWHHGDFGGTGIVGRHIPILVITRVFTAGSTMNNALSQGNEG